LTVNIDKTVTKRNVPKDDVSILSIWTGYEFLPKYDLSKEMVGVRCVAMNQLNSLNFTRRGSLKNSQYNSVHNSHRSVHNSHQNDHYSDDFIDSYHDSHHDPRRR